MSAMETQRLIVKGVTGLNLYFTKFKNGLELAVIISINATHPYLQPNTPSLPLNEEYRCRYQCKKEYWP